MNAHLTSLGDQIREARQAKGLKQHHIAKALEVTVQAVSQWERDETAPSGINMLKLGCLLSIETMPHFIFDLAELGAVQPRERALPGDEARVAEVRTAVDATRVSELRDEIENAYDLMTALDKTGDGIGGDLGHGVSAVALAARAALDNARSMVRAMEAGR